MKIDVILERGTDGTYDARMEVKKELSFWLLGQGNTVENAIADFFVTKDDMKAIFCEQGKEFPELEFEFKYDTASFLDYYSKILSLAGLSRLTGVNQGLLSHYITGRKHPRKETIRKIETAINSLGKELSQAQFV